MTRITPTSGPEAETVATGVNSLLSFAAGSSAVSNGLTLDTGTSHSTHTLVATPSAAVTSGFIALATSQDNVNWVTSTPTTLATIAVPTAVTVTGAYRYIRAVITTVIVGATISATVASS